MTTAILSPSPQSVVGAGAAGSSVIGNPVLIGMSDGTNARTFTAQELNADGVALTTSYGVVTYGVMVGYNGTSFDRIECTNQSMNVFLAAGIAGEDLTNNVMKVEGQFSYQYISTGATTTIKSGSGFLHAITVTGGTAGTVIIYDNTAGSGTILASFDSTNAIATYKFNVKYNTGLTVVTGAATKITVAWR